jgi:hypothetical protein
MSFQRIRIFFKRLNPPHNKNPAKEEDACIINFTNRSWKKR